MDLDMAVDMNSDFDFDMGFVDKMHIDLPHDAERG